MLTHMESETKRSPERPSSRESLVCAHIRGGQVIAGSGYMLVVSLQVYCKFGNISRIDSEWVNFCNDSFRSFV